MLPSVSGPPLARGMMWSGTVLSVTLPLVMQSRHSGSAISRRLRVSTPLRPRCLGVGVMLLSIVARSWTLAVTVLVKLAS